MLLLTNPVTVWFFTLERDLDRGRRGPRGLITTQVSRTCHSGGLGLVGGRAGLGTNSCMTGMWDYSKNWPLPTVGGAGEAKVGRVPETWAGTGQVHPAA